MGARNPALSHCTIICKWWLFSWERPISHTKELLQAHLLGTPSVGSQIGPFRVTQTCLGWRSIIYRFYRWWTSKIHLPIPAFYFTIMTQFFWFIDFLGVNKIDLVEQVCQLFSATPVTVRLFHFLKRVPHLLCIVHTSSSFVSDCVASPCTCQPWRNGGVLLIKLKKPS